MAFRGDAEDELYALRAIAGHGTPIVNYEAFPEIERNAIAVDAACAAIRDEWSIAVWM